VADQADTITAPTSLDVALVPRLCQPIARIDACILGLGSITIPSELKLHENFDCSHAGNPLLPISASLVALIDMPHDG
jgi:hypothetical protein